MKKIISKNNLILVLSALFIFFIALSTFTFQKAKANTQIEANLYLPKTAMEYFDLNVGAPQDAIYFDNKVAIISEAKTLVVYDGAYSSRNLGGLLKQVKLFNQNTLLVSSNAILTLVQVNDLDFRKELKYNDNGEEKTVTGEKFDLNSNYLISAIGTSANIYGRNETGITSPIDSRALDGSLINGKPVCINETNDIFYISGTDVQRICKRTIIYNANTNGSLTEEVVVATASPDNMIANNKYVYFTQGQKTYRVSVNGGEVEELILSVDSRFELGKLDTPSGICFKNENLLITDSSLHAVQEFSITAENHLEFTGFAIAKSKTAFNRIGATATEIEKFGKTVAIKDAYKITLINGTNYQNILVNDIDMFALGKTSLIFYNFDNRSLTYYDLQTESTISIVNDKIKVTDICYSNGNFYIVYNDIAENVNVALIPEGSAGFSLNDIIKNQKIKASTGSILLTVDTDANVYLTSAENNGSIAVYTKESNYQTSKTLISNLNIGSIKKLNVDLCGNVFALMPNNKILKINEDGSEELTISPLASNIDGFSNNEITSFAMDYEEEQVYFIINGEETIFTTTELTNVALNSLEFSVDPFEEKSSTNIEDLKIYQVKENSTLYSIEINGLKFNYKGLFANTNEEYIKLATITHSNVTFVALAVQSEYGKAVTILAKENDLTDVTTITQSTLTRSYVSTNVCAYYLPLITEGDVFTLKLNGEKIRIEQNTEFFPVNSSNFSVVTFLNKEFYYATVNHNGNLINCYIPVTFTVEKLSQIEYNPTFTYRNVYETTVYKFNTLEEELITLQNNTEIRLIEINEGACKIMYKTEDETWEIGYVSETGLQPIKNVYLRNILIAGCILICIFATSLFLILRKKNA